MYDYNYEEDILLSLRLLKFLHEQDPEAAKKLVGIFKEFTPDEIYELTNLALWEIFDDVAFDSDSDDESSIATISHPAIDRLYELGCRLETAHGRLTVGWLRKIHDIVEFFVCGASNSIYSLDLWLHGGHVEIRMGLSQDCYEPILYGNSLVDVLLYVQRENIRLEPLVREAEREPESEIRKEAA